MAQLENPKHEAFCLSLAQGQGQAESYVLAGYSNNPSAASRLASSPRIKDRVEELRKEIYRKINVAIAKPNEETFGSLAEMGLTMVWVAEAFKGIYEDAVRAGQFAPANTAVQNIQKLIEIENGGKPDDGNVDGKNLIRINDVTKMLQAVKDIANLPKVSHEPELVDVTPDKQTHKEVLKLVEDVEENAD